MLSEKQSGVLKGMLAGVAITVAGLALVLVLQPAALVPIAAGDAISHALRWDLLVVASLAVSIGALARHRFFTPDDIDGGGLTQGTQKARVLQSLLQNTLEQSVLAFGTHLVWAASMPWQWQAVVPVAAGLFLVGRILFWLGYANGAPSRALGFSLTFYPSAVMLVFMAIAAVAGV